jgi:hypothetical protein
MEVMYRRMSTTVEKKEEEHGTALKMILQHRETDGDQNPEQNIHACQEATHPHPLQVHTTRATKKNILRVDVVDMRHPHLLVAPTDRAEILQHLQPYIDTHPHHQPEAIGESKNHLFEDATSPSPQLSLTHAIDHPAHPPEPDILHPPPIHASIQLPHHLQPFAGTRLRLLTATTRCLFDTTPTLTAKKIVIYLEVSVEGT